MNRSFCFTLNNPTNEEFQHLVKTPYDTSGRCSIAYMCFQPEVGESGTFHLQGYCELDGPARPPQAKGLLGTKRIHIEPRRGTRTQARDYCIDPSKRATEAQLQLTFGHTFTPVPLESKFYEFPDWVKQGQGRRTDLDIIAALVMDENKSAYEVAHAHPAHYIRYHRGVSALCEATQHEQHGNCCRDVTCFTYWGVTGAGKTHRVYAKHPFKDIFKLTQGQTGSCTWFSGYTGQPVLLIDDFYGWIKLGELLTYLDKYPQMVQTKGGQAYAAWTTVYLTSNKHPKNWYSRRVVGKAPRKALKRRLTQSGSRIIECTHSFITEVSSDSESDACHHVPMHIE